MEYCMCVIITTAVFRCFRVCTVTSHDFLMITKHEFSPGITVTVFVS